MEATIDTSGIDLSSAAPAKVVMTNPDGTTQEVTRVPLREVFEVFEDIAPPETSGRTAHDPTIEEGRCFTCDQQWVENAMYHAYRHWMATNHRVEVVRLSRITFQNHPLEQADRIVDSAVGSVALEGLTPSPKVVDASRDALKEAWSQEA